jgi:hypothetical protein
VSCSCAIRDLLSAPLKMAVKISRSPRSKHTRTRKYNLRPRTQHNLRPRRIRQHRAPHEHGRRRRQHKERSTQKAETTNWPGRLRSGAVAVSKFEIGDVGIVQWPQDGQPYDVMRCPKHMVPANLRPTLDKDYYFIQYVGYIRYVMLILSSRILIPYISL